MSQVPPKERSSPDAPRCFALIPCAGTGTRAGTSEPKQYHPLAGQAMVMHTVQALAAVVRIQAAWLVLSPGDTHPWPLAPVWPAHFHRLACGGSSRAQSVCSGLRSLLSHAPEVVRPQDWILVHDAARCLVTPEDINRLIDACWSDPVGGLLALPLPDTLKVAVQGRVSTTLARADKWLAQTPQMFRAGELLAALEAKADTGFEGITDEASAIELTGRSPLLVSAGPHNFKVTYPQDFALAEALLRSRS